MSNDVIVTVSGFHGSTISFIETTNSFLISNEDKKGYKQLLDLVNNYDLSKYHLYQASIDSVLVGLSAVRTIEETLHFDILCVDSDFREIGVADELFSYIVNDRQGDGAKYYESMALPGDRSTKNFFEQRGGKARLLIIEGTLPL